MVEREGGKGGSVYMCVYVYIVNSQEREKLNTIQKSSIYV